MGSKRRSSGTQTTRSEPWGPAQPYLQEALAQAQQGYQSGAFSYEPFQGQRVAGFTPDSLSAFSEIRNRTQSPLTQMALSGIENLAQSPDTLSAFQNVRNFERSPLTQQAVQGIQDYSQSPDTLTGLAALRSAAQAPQSTQQAQNTLSSLLDPSSGSGVNYDRIVNDALAGAVPAATAAFSGAGLANSSVAQDAVGRAAGKAVASALAPYEYEARQNALDRALSAVQVAPQLDRAAYTPARALIDAGSITETFDRDRLNALAQAGAREEAFESGQIGALQNIGQQQEAFTQNQINQLGQAGREQENFNENQLSLLSRSGALQQQQQQSLLDAVRQAYQEGQSVDYDALARYANLIYPQAGFGGTSSGRTGGREHPTLLGTLGSLFQGFALGRAGGFF